MPIINLIPAKSSMVLAAGTESIIVRKGIILYKNLWVKNNSSDPYYQYKIEDEKITKESTVELHVDLDYYSVAKTADIKPKTDSFDGYVILYATNLPLMNIPCDYVIQKEATTTKLYMDGSDIDLTKVPFKDKTGKLQANTAHGAIMELAGELFGTVNNAISGLNTSISNLDKKIDDNTEALTNAINNLAKTVSDNNAALTNAINQLSTKVDNQDNALSTTITQVNNSLTTKINDLNTKINNIGTYIVPNTAPSKTNVLWIDTSNGGVLKYHNGSSWQNVYGVWR